MAQSANFDLIVLGTGGGGCAAALSGAAMGLSVCLIEKDHKLGGGTADSLGTIWMPCNSLAKAEGLADEIDDVLTYARYVGGGQDVPENTQTYVRQASHVLDELLSYGMKLRLALNLPDYFYPSGPGSAADGRRMVEPELISDKDLGPWAGRIRKSFHNVPGVTWSDGVKWGGFANRRNWPEAELQDRQARKLLGCGEALIGQFVMQMLARGVDIRAGVQVTRLRRQGGRVSGVELADGTMLTARRGVVLATGGYEGNPELVRQYEGIPEWMNPFGPLNEGDGLVMAAELGAAVHRIGVNNSMFVGSAIPGQTPPAFFSVGLRGLPMPGAIAVNAAGKRFCDETQFQDVVMAFQQYDRRARKFANLPAFMIFDDRFRTRYPLMNAMPGAPVHPDVTRANTLVELARAIGIDPEAFTATVEDFNRDARDGQDQAFGRGRSAFSKNNAGDRELRNAQLAPLEQAPFYALPLKIGGVCSAGLLTDSSARVLDMHHQPVPGLYACGNTAAPTFLGVGYQGGSSIGAGIVFGYLAARDASQAG